MQAGMLSTMREYFRWMTRRKYLPFNPASELEMPRVPKRLPRAVLTAEEAERILSVPDITTVVGLRDRACMEVLYSTGMRRSEVSGLKIADVEFENGTVFIEQGKGRKDRIVPIGRRALSWLRRYLDNSRPALVTDEDDGRLFLSAVCGMPFSVHAVTKMVTDYRKRAGIEKRGSSHIFRHTTATLMLENGADVRFVQEMLGHSSLSSTQIYTHVAIAKLKEVHERTHPAKDKERTPS